VLRVVGGLGHADVLRQLKHAEVLKGIRVCTGFVVCLLVSMEELGQLVRLGKLDDFFELFLVLL